MKRIEAALARYCSLVAAAPISLTALRDPSGIERELVGDALAARDLIGPALPARVVDVGSGNGSPGIPLAIAYDAPVTLLDANRRKAGFLRDAAASLGLDATVVAERSETYGQGAGRDAFDLVLARALAPPPVALELCLPLAAVGGRVVLWTGDVEAAPLEAVARQLGGSVTRIEAYGGRRLVEAVKLEPTPERFPRRPGMAGKRPLA